MSNQCEQRKIVSPTHWFRCARDKHPEDVPHSFTGEPEPRTDNVKTEAFSIREVAQMALDVQDASNGAGIAFTLATRVFPSVLASMRERKKDTNWANAHPVVYLFLYKLLDLADTGQAGFLEFGRNYEKVQKLARGVDPKGVY